jgi:beta-glucosidase-like glycosyl hydrolase
VIDPVSHIVEPLDVCRRFGSEPDEISTYAGAFVEGLHSVGTATCATEALTGSLNEAYRRASDDILVDEEFLELIEQELLPLRRLHDANLLDCLTLSSRVWDFNDARQSRKCIQFIIDKVVRGKLEYDGPIVIDCATLPLEASVCSVHAPLHALLAGVDMVFLPLGDNNQRASVKAIHAAVVADERFRTAVLRSSGRVTTLKGMYLAQQEARGSLGPGDLPALVAAHRQLAREAYRASVVSCQSGPSPLLSLPQGSVVLLLTPAVPVYRTEVGQQDPFEYLGRPLSRSQPRIRHVPYSLSAGLTPTHSTFLQRVQAVVLVLACPSSALTEVQSELWLNVENVLVSIEGQGKPKVTRLVVSAGDARDLFTTNMLSKGWWAVACWDYTRGALEAVAEVLVGEKEATGRMPFAR